MCPTCRGTLDQPNGGQQTQPSDGSASTEQRVRVHVGQPSVSRAALGKERLEPPGRDVEPRHDRLRLGNVGKAEEARCAAAREAAPAAVVRADFAPHVERGGSQDNTHLKLQRTGRERVPFSARAREARALEPLRRCLDGCDALREGAGLAI